MKLESALEETSQACSSEPGSVPWAQTAARPSSHSASDSDSSSPMTGHRRLLPLPERAGVAPFSHSGSEPSAQEKEPLLSRAGALPSSQDAAVSAGTVSLGPWASECLPGCLLAWRVLPLRESCVHTCVRRFALACEQAILCVCASVCEGPSSAATSTARNTANVTVEAKRRVDVLMSKAIGGWGWWRSAGSSSSCRSGASVCTVFGRSGEYEQLFRPRWALACPLHFEPRSQTMPVTDQEKAAKARDAALQGALTQIEREFGKGSVMRMGDEGAQVRCDAIPTGALSLDLALGIGGVPRGRIVEVFGPESSGKTTMIYHVLAEAQKLGGV